jgi:hypothetical protein
LNWFCRRITQFVIVFVYYFIEGRLRCGRNGVVRCNAPCRNHSLRRAFSWSAGCQILSCLFPRKPFIRKVGLKGTAARRTSRDKRVPFNAVAFFVSPTGV